MTFISQGEPLSEAQVQDLNLQVRTILAHNCYSCHGRAKVKGELRLDTKAFMMKGGEDGVVVVPGHPEESEIIRRIKLPRHHKDKMPAKGKALNKLLPFMRLQILYKGINGIGWWWQANHVKVNSANVCSVVHHFFPCDIIFFKVDVYKPVNGK